MFTKRIILVIITLLIINTPISAYAIYEDTVSERLKPTIARPMWTEIAEFSIELSISSAGRATVESVLYAFNVDEIHLNCQLQQYRNGGWTTIKSWTNSSNNVYCTISEAYYVVSGYSYRLVSTGKVYKNGRLVEQETLTSRTQVY